MNPIIKKENCFTYYIDVDKRTVACVYNPEEDVHQLRIKLANNCFYTTYEDLKKTLALKRDYTGKANCSPVDAFDVEIGKSVSRRRALQKYYKAQNKYLRGYLKQVYSAAANVNKLIELSTINIIKNETRKEYLENDNKRAD